MSGFDYLEELKNFVFQNEQNILFFKIVNDLFILLYFTEQINYLNEVLKKFLLFLLFLFIYLLFLLNYQ